MKQFIVVWVVLFGFFSAFAQEPAPTVYFIGGSTTSEYPPERYPRMGWGQAMPRFFTSEVRFSNQAAEGRSTKSFRDEGRWQVILDSLQPGDYVFIQFGHNDQKEHRPKLYTKPFTTFADNLRRYVEEIRSKQATPVLVTSIHRRRFDKIGRVKNSLGLYPAAMRKVAHELTVPLVDLHAASEVLMNELGPEGSKKLFMWLKPGEHQNYPEGVEDNTHLTEAGAMAMAAAAVQDLKRNGVALISYLRD
ncbi:MAG: rhamnogalacturonan acetylesterase [Tunicatimonas sp.]